MISDGRTSPRTGTEILRKFNRGKMIFLFMLGKIIFILFFVLFQISFQLCDSNSQFISLTKERSVHFVSQQREKCIVTCRIQIKVQLHSSFSL